MEIKHKSFSNFFIVWFGQLISAIGSGLTAFVLSTFVYEKTHSATSYTLIFLFSFLPAFIFRPFGGVLADRFDRRILMIIGDLGAALGILFILYFMFLGQADLFHICIGVTISSLFVGLQNPAYKASVSDLVTEEYYVRASGLMQLADSSPYLISPLLAGVLLAIFDIKYVLIIDIFTFLVAILSIIWVKHTISTNQTSKPKQHFFKDLYEGFQFTISNKGIFWLMITLVFVLFGVGLLSSLWGPMMLNFVNIKTFGIVQSISASGLLISSFFIGAFGKQKNLVAILSFFLMLTGLFYSGIGLSTNIFVITTFGFLLFFTLPFVNTSLDVLIRKNVPNEKQGRVWSFMYSFSSIGSLLAYSVAGFLADYVFNPLLMPGGLLASTVGKLIGVGLGRGIGLLFIIAGLFVSIFGILLGRVKVIKDLEKTSSIN